MYGIKIAHLAVKAVILSRPGVKGRGKKDIYSFNGIKYLQGRKLA